MKKRIAVSMAFCLAVFFANSARCERIEKTIPAGNISIVVDAEVPFTAATQAQRYTATPHDWDEDAVIRAFWPESDAATVLAAGVSYKDSAVTLDGKQVFMETFSNDGDILAVYKNEGGLLFASASMDAWTAKCSDYQTSLVQDAGGGEGGWVEASGGEEYQTEATDPIAALGSLEEITAFAQDLLTSLGLNCKIAPVAQSGYRETLCDDTYEYNAVDYIVLLDDIPCDNRSYATALSSDNRAIPAQSLSVIFDEAGLASFSLTVFDVEPSGDPGAILSYEAALEAMANDNQMILASDSVTIRSMLLCYVMTPVSGKMLTYTYEPVWRLSTADAIWSGVSTQSGDLYYYSALTGKAIR